MQVLELFCPVFEDSPHYNKVIRAIFDSLLNGDWRLNGTVEHYCRGCCKNAKETMRKIVEFVGHALAGRAPGIFARHHWCGADIVLNWTGLFEACHGLLRDCLGIMYPQSDKKKPEAQRDDAEDPPVGLADVVGGAASEEARRSDPSPSQPAQDGKEEGSDWH